jgi:hypothetical protein
MIEKEKEKKREIRETLKMLKNRNCKDNIKRYKEELQ